MAESEQAMLRAPAVDPATWGKSNSDFICIFCGKNQKYISASHDVAGYREDQHENAQELTEPENQNWV